MPGFINTEGLTDYSCSVLPFFQEAYKVYSFICDSYPSGFHSNQENKQNPKTLFYYYLLASFPLPFFPLWKMAIVTVTGRDEECTLVFNVRLKEALIDPC